MARGTFRILALVCTVVFSACGDAGTPTDIAPSYDKKAVEPPRDFVTLISGQLKLPAGAMPFATATIGAAGGSVTLNGLPKDGQPTFHRIVVPAGAVNAPTLFVIQLSSSSAIDVDLFAFRQNSHGKMNNVGELGFLKPVYLELSFAWATSPVDPARLHVGYLVGNRVRERMPTQANAHARKVIGELRHFSRYAVLAD